MFEFLKYAGKGLGLGATKDELRQLAEISLDRAALECADAIGNKEETSHQINAFPTRLGAFFGAQLTAH